MNDSEAPAWVVRNDQRRSVDGTTSPQCRGCGATYAHGTECFYLNRTLARRAGIGTSVVIAKALQNKSEECSATQEHEMEFPRDSKSWIQTFSGKVFFPLNARPEEVDIVDIAHHLAAVCRFTGATLTPYNVAQHSVHVAEFVEGVAAAKGWDPSRVRCAALAALLHDATEAYMNDFCRPVKGLMPTYIEAEHRLERVIAKRFGLPDEMEIPGLADMVKAGDDVVLATEQRDLMAPCAAPWNLKREPLRDIVIVAWTARESELRFLKEFYRLGGVR